MLDMIVEVLEAILRWFVSIVASGFQFLAGIIFNSMNDFMGSDQNIIINVLEPVHNFSVYYLKPLSLALLGLLLVWSFLQTMFGKFSTSRDEPATLFGRAVFFAICIALSSDIIGLIGGTTTLSDGRKVPGIVLQMTDAMSDVGTSVDNDKSKLSITSKAYKNLQTILDNSTKSVDDFTGYNSLDVNGVEQPSGDENNINASTYQGSNTKNIGYVLTNHANVYAFVIYIASLLIYLLVYGLLFLWIAWRCLKVCSRYVYRFIIFLVLLYMAPLAFACGPSKSTQKIFSEWLKMIVSYSLLLVLTAAFMRVSTFVINAGFYYAATDLTLVNVVVSFIAVLMFLKMIFELERYVEKLGLSAIGLPDSVSGITGLAREVGKNLLRDQMRNAQRQLIDDIKSPMPSLNPESASSIPDESVKNVFEQGVTNVDENGKPVHDVAHDMMDKGDNDEAFIENPEGEYARGTDGLMHELDENGEAIDGSELKSGQRYEMTDTDDSIVRSNVDGMDDASTYTSITDADSSTGLVENPNGDYLMASDSDVNNGVAVAKSSLETDDDGNIQKYSVNADNDGNLSYSQNKDGEYVKVKEGGLVNVGKDSASYSMRSADGKYAVNKLTGRLDNVSNYFDKDGNLTVSNPMQKAELERMYGSSPEFKDVQKIKYKTGGNGTKNLNAKNGRYAEKTAYNTNLPEGAKISAINRLEYCDTLEKHADGTKKGIALQHLENGENRYVKFAIYDVNELTKDEINHHRKYSRNNPCEGYTPDGKQYIHIEKYMNSLKNGDRKVKPRKNTW